MRSSLTLALVLFAALALTGCSIGVGPTRPSTSAAPSPPSAHAAGPSASATPRAVAKPAPGAAVSPTPARTSSAEPSDPEAHAVEAVIQKANQEQSEAFAKNDPSIMKDTATSAYYQELVQINSNMAQGGVASIRLIKTEWGDVSVTNATTAHATTFETWRTDYSDGSTDQSRERNDYTLVKKGNSWKIHTDDNPGTSTTSSGGASTADPSGQIAPSSPFTPAPSSPGQPASGTDTSTNWSGYAATSGVYTQVKGSWTVPVLRSSSGLSSGASWVGIGGVDSRDLIQAGTMETTTGSGQVGYEAWVETLPQTARQVPFTVKPGDSVTGSITEQGSSNRWAIEINNNTTGENYKTTVQYRSSRSSAEWIEEAPSAGRRVLPIDDFGTVQFSGGSAIKNGKSVTIAESGAKPITMAASRGSAVVTPSVLTPDGQGFTVSRSASTPVRRGRSRSRY